MGKVSRWSAMALACVVFVGCEGPDYPPASAGCEDFIETWCDKNSSCVAPSERADDRETCIFSTKLSLDCSKTLGVSNTLKDCIAAVRATSCDGYTREKGLPLPEPCKGVLYVP